MNKVEEKLEGLDSEQRRALYKIATREAADVLRVLVGILAKGVTSRTTAYDVAYRGDAYIKTLPSDQRCWVFDVMSILKDAEGPGKNAWVAAWMRLTDKRTWRDVAQTQKRTQYEVKVDVHYAVLFLVMSMDDRHITRRP